MKADKTNFDKTLPSQGKSFLALPCQSILEHCVETGSYWLTWQEAMLNEQPKIHITSTFPVLDYSAHLNL